MTFLPESGGTFLDALAVTLGDGCVAAIYGWLPFSGCT